MSRQLAHSLNFIDAAQRACRDYSPGMVHLGDQPRGKYLQYQIHFIQLQPKPEPNYRYEQLPGWLCHPGRDFIRQYGPKCERLRMYQLINFLSTSLVCAQGELGASYINMYRTDRKGDRYSSASCSILSYLPFRIYPTFLLYPSSPGSSTLSYFLSRFSHISRSFIYLKTDSLHYAKKKRQAPPPPFYLPPTPIIWPRTCRPAHSSAKEAYPMFRRYGQQIQRQ